MYYTIFGIVCFTLFLWTVGSYVVVRSIEQPSYTVLEKRSGYEIRQYESYIIAETEVTGTYAQATNQGFSIIADYIFGNNTSNSKIAMTSPVLENNSEKIAMTTPVLNTLEGDQTRTISFILPSKYTLQTLPIPNNEQVTLREIPAQTMAAHRFTWYATANRVETQKEFLENQLMKEEIKVTGSTKVARYNPPLSMPLMLRNEILIPIE